MTTTTVYPATVRELAEQAIARGIPASELLASLPTPPAGFTLDKGSEEAVPGGTWSGPAFTGEKWEVTSHWTAEEGVTFYVDGDGDNAIKGIEAGKIAAALAEVAALK